MYDYICFSWINSLPIVNDYFVKYSTSDHSSMFAEQVNCINQRKDVHHHQVSMHIEMVCKDEKRKDNSICLKAKIIVVSFSSYMFFFFLSLSLFLFSFANLAWATYLSRRLYFLHDLFFYSIVVLLSSPTIFLRIFDLPFILINNNI